MDDRLARSVPYSREAEEALIGAALLSSTAQEVLATSTTPETDFYVGHLREVAVAITDLHRRGIRSDPTTVGSWLRDHGTWESSGGAETINLAQVAVPSTGNADGYARVIRANALRRQIIASASEIVRFAYDRAADLDEVLAAVNRMADLDAPGRNEGADQEAEGLAGISMDYEWLVPGLLERGDRVLWTGAEAGGKSTLLMQLGVQMAAGIHPWTGKRIRPLQVLLLDLENSPAMLARRLRPLLDASGMGAQQVLGSERAGSLRVRAHPQGIDLLRLEDRQWLIGRMVANAPVDVLITGPLYKMHSGKPIDEEPAAKVARFLDQLRSRFGCALLLEAHSPHASDDSGERTLRPYGASLWLRWPEFGFGIRPAGKAEPNVWKLVPWKSRDRDREWPYRMTRGSPWPWVQAQTVTQGDPNEPMPSPPPDWAEEDF